MSLRKQQYHLSKIYVYSNDELVNIDSLHNEFSQPKTTGFNKIKVSIIHYIQY